MAFAITGLKVKKTYEQLIGVAVDDKLYNIKFPNRDAKFEKWFCTEPIRR